MAQKQARFKPGIELPCFAKTAVVGGHFVKVVDVMTSQGDIQVGHCGAGEVALGVAEYDSAAATDPADQASRRINVVTAPVVARVLPGANIVAGALIASDGTGLAVTATVGKAILGQALETKASTDSFVLVKLFTSPVPVPA